MKDSFSAAKVRFFDATKKGGILCVCGPSGSGKSTLVKRIKKSGDIVLDGDPVRFYINGELGFSDRDRVENNRRIAGIAVLLCRQGFDVIVSTVRADIAHDFIRDMGECANLVRVSLNGKVRIIEGYINMGNYHIENSCTKEYEDILYESSMLWVNNPKSDMWQHRTVKGIVREWVVHNALYKLHLFRSHTKDLDINWPQPWYEKFAYSFFFPFARIIVR